MRHFTCACLDRHQLLQGDIIKRTEDVDAILEEVLPHYSRAEYPFFIVLTQSCDLVRRDGKRCASRYVTVAAVRPVQRALEREIQRFQYRPVEKRLGFCNRTRKPKMVQLAERLLNNNQSGYFFLQHEPGSGLEDDHCAFLKLSIALKSELHYGTLLEGKILQLSEPFQHKLRYLVGTMYSRIGTEDWVPGHTTQKDFQARATRMVEDLVEVEWIEKDLHRRVLRDLEKLREDQQTDELLVDVIEKNRMSREDRIQKGLDSIESILEGIWIEPSLMKRIRGRLDSSSYIRSKLSR